MKYIYDVIAALYFVGLLSLAVFFFPEEFKNLTSHHPYLMGFVKVSLLATFGEYLKRRLTSGGWSGDPIHIFLLRFVGWGIFGLWFTFVFPLFSFGVDACVKAGLWPQGPSVWIAFSKSLWINILGMFGWSMMLSHEWLNTCFAKKRLVSLASFGKEIDTAIWFGFVPKTVLFFWLPAHTITFVLPGVWRILMAAALSVVLGFLLTVSKKK